MANTMHEIIHGKKKHSGRRANPSGGAHQSNDPSQETWSQRDFFSRRPTVPAQPSVVATSGRTHSGSEEPRPNLRKQTQVAFQSIKGTLSGLFGGRKQRAHNGTTLTNSDLEGQPEEERHGENESSNNDHQQAAGGSTEARDMETSRQEEYSVPPSSNNRSASRQTSVQQRRSTDTTRMRTSPTGEDGRLNNDQNLDHESMPGMDFNQRHRRSQYAPTIHTRWQANRHETTPPSGNLHEYLIRGYYQPGALAYQPRRTLDQYGYADIETTSHRDDDQVIYRYTKDDPMAEIKIFMVDHLWLWVLGKGLSLITYQTFNWDSSLT